MSQSTVVRILAIESEATRIRDQASAQAAEMLADFERETAAKREQALNEAEVEARRLREEGQRAANSQRMKIVAQAEADALEMDSKASHGHSAAVQYILDRVAGRP